MIDFKDIIQPVDNLEIAKYQDECQFMCSHVELNKQIIVLLFKCCDKYLNVNDLPKFLSEEDAVIAGNMARLYKLCHSFLQNICDQKAEICFILFRCITETCLNIKYMLLNGENNVRRNYIKYSLITEKKVYKKVCQNIHNREEEELPIEKRMKISIKNSFDSSNIQLEEVKNSSRWKSLSSRVAVVEDPNFYSILYGLSSHSIHGNWQDLLSNHLNKTEKGFEIDLTWTQPRPQMMEGVSFQLLAVIKIFNKLEIKNEEDRRAISNLVDNFETTLKILLVNHEKLINKGKPSI